MCQGKGAFSDSQEKMALSREYKWFREKKKKHCVKQKYVKTRFWRTKREKQQMAESLRNTKNSV